jgi:hypothetical protein
MPGKHGTLRERFERFVVRADGDGCWGWKGSTTEKGYGRLSNVSRAQRYVRAHRVSWELTYGPVPAGLYVLHRCDNPACTRPDHLFLGSIADNQADMAKKARGTQKLTAEQVREIRASYASGLWTQRELARQFGVGQTCISKIVTNAKRKYVD